MEAERNEEIENTEEPEIEGQEPQEEEISLRDTLENAVEEVEGAEDGEEGQPQDSVDKVSQGGSDSAETGDNEQFSQQAVPFDGDDGKSFKAPASWKPKEREYWTKVPVELQARIKTREAEMDHVLRESANARQTHEFVSQLATGYAPLLAAEGMPDVGTGIKGMFETVALLQNGAPEMKAMKMAQLINHYGIDINAIHDPHGSFPHVPAHETSQHRECRIGV
jgi:hypothetical protein